MKSEKYIKDNLNQALDDIAPDILNKILVTERITEDNIDNDLREEPLFLDETEHKLSKRRRVSVFAAMVLALAMICAAFVPRLTVRSNRVYCSITVDINPSINLHMNKNGQVIKVDANNNDGTQIAKQISKNIAEDYYAEDAVNDVLLKLRDAGYLDKKNATMLISSDKSYKGSSQGISTVRNAINRIKNENNDNFVTVYQEYKQNKQVDKIAEDNDISVAKAAYCLKISEKTKESCDKLCKESIAKITKKIVDDKVDLGEEIEIVEEIESFIEEVESATEEKTEELSSDAEEWSSENTETTIQINETQSNENATMIEESDSVAITSQESQTTVPYQETTDYLSKETEVASQ